AGGPVRGRVPKSRAVANRIGDSRRNGVEGNHGLPRTRGDRETFLVRLVRGAQEGTTHRPQSEDRQGSADLAAPRDGVQTVGNSQAADQLRRRRRWQLEK